MFEKAVEQCFKVLSDYITASFHYLKRSYCCFYPIFAETQIHNGCGWRCHIAAYVHSL